MRRVASPIAVCIAIPPIRRRFPPLWKETMKFAASGRDLPNRVHVSSNVLESESQERQQGPASSTAASAPALPQSPAGSAPPSSGARSGLAEVTIPAGERVTVRMIDAIDSDRNQAGQVFRASLASPLVSRGRVVVPTGAPVTVVLANESDAGRIKGAVL